ncbi:hypothetical protein L218DRAFT_216911 [Marasmius fiardii PR-910]|nr:hypothetical protein L218DRAFT_216911 [Marasmius fiardii PR-910]
MGGIVRTLVQSLPARSSLTPIQEAEGAQAVNQSSVAALAFLVYDVLITIDEEVNLIWPRPWSFLKVIYVFVRYIPVLVQISIIFVGTELPVALNYTPRDCFIWMTYQAAALITIVATVDLILILRVFALYHDNRLVKYIVGALYLVYLAGMCAGLVLGVPKIKYNSLCVVIDAANIMALYLGSAMFFQTVLFLLTTAKFISAVRAGWGNVPILRVVMRDGTWAFTLLLLIEAGYGSLYALPNRSYAGILYGWLLTAFSFSGYRILLNLNNLGETVTFETSFRQTTGLWFTSHISDQTNLP